MSRGVLRCVMPKTIDAQSAKDDLETSAPATASWGAALRLACALLRPTHQKQRIERFAGL